MPSEECSPSHPPDTTGWTESEVDAFAESASPDAVGDVIIALASDGGPDALRVLKLFLGSRHADTFLKPIPSRSAVVALASLGEKGVAVLRDALVSESDRLVRYKSAIVDVLLAVAHGTEIPWHPVAPPVKALEGLQMGPEAQAAAAQCLRDFAAESVVNPDLFATVVQSMYMASLAESLGIPSPRARELLELLVDASIRLSPSVIDEYIALISAQETEEAYQRFLRDNPVFLDPLADRVIPKQRLGLEYATDYAVQRLDGRWLLVEIEKPTTPIMTQGHDFTAEFTHAFGQVLDFQHWVDDNVAYAQRHMERITSPRGLLIIGLRSNLDERSQAKLRTFVDNSSRIDVFTFDDLLFAAENLYSNLRRQALTASDSAKS